MSRLRILLATGNAHKFREIADLLHDLPIDLVSLSDLDLRLDIVEDGATYEENALKKAIAAAEASGLPTMADDSGIEVTALDGRPGIRSARYAGPEATDSDNNDRLLEELAGVPADRRGARYGCAAVLVLPGPGGPQTRAVCRRTWKGRITEGVRGSAGFGYDPLFLISAEAATVGELGDAYKQDHSHRAQAFRCLIPHLEALAAGAADPSE